MRPAHTRVACNCQPKGHHWTTAREKKPEAAAHPVVEVSYDVAFARIQAATGISHVEELVAAFITAEDHNFSMFNFVNELNQEAEKLEEQAAELQSEMERHTGAGASEDSHRKRLVAELEEKLAACNARAAALDVKYAAGARTLDGLKAAISIIFEETGCNTAATRELLGDPPGVVTESNVLQFLALIEQRSSELLALYMQCVAKMPGNRVPSDGSTQPPVGMYATGGGLNIEPPSAVEEFAGPSDEESEDDDDYRPLTREELAARTQRRLQLAAIKKEKGGKPLGGRRNGRN